MAVALQYLIGYRCREEPQFPAGPLFHLRRYGGVRADGPGYFPHSDCLFSLAKALLVAPHLFNPYRQLEAEGNWLGMNAVGAPYHRGIFVLHGFLCQHCNQFFNIFGKQFGGFHQLQTERCVHNV